MLSKSYTILNPTGFHIRPARLFADTANERFPATEVKVTKGAKAINGKSVLSMLTLGAKYQETVTIQVEGGSEAEALEILGAFFETIHKE